MVKRIAIVHEWLTGYAGAERVVEKTTYQNLKYGFSNLSDENLISSFARRLYTLENFPVGKLSLFSTRSDFYLFRQRNRLFSTLDREKWFNTYNTDPDDIWLRMIMAE